MANVEQRWPLVGHWTGSWPMMSALSGPVRIVVVVPVCGSVRLLDGSTRQMPLAELTAGVVLSGVPWRSVRSHRGQRHLPGWYWSATTGGHVVYESRLELGRLLLADFDSDVVGIAAQPFLVRDADRRHVPDFLLDRADGSVVIVNVKPAQQLGVEQVADALAWAGRVFADRGWEHEVWSGADAQLLANVRFLAGYRRAALLEPAPRAAMVLPAGSVVTVSAAEAALRDAGVTGPRPVVLGLLWSGRLRADLAQPLVDDSELEVLW
ncbi:MAG: TnsA-like heteromeric transposase endonuclease subunit [Solirubrobacteraceae bacterium]